MYQFLIPNTKLVYYQIFAYAIMILNILGLYLFGLLHKEYHLNIIPFAIGATLVIIWDIFRYKKTGTLLSIGIFLLVFGFLWMTSGVTEAFFVNIVLWGLYIISKRKLIIHVDTSNVRYPSFPEKRIDWRNIGNIILKDDILTIDLKNNKIYQHLIKYPNNEVNETEFNDFCTQQLNLKIKVLKNT